MIFGSIAFAMMSIFDWSFVLTCPCAPEAAMRKMRALINFIGNLQVEVEVYTLIPERFPI